MIRRVELQHKIKYFSKEYSVMLYNDTDFTTAFKTLQYPFGITASTERVLIPIDPNDCSEIFIENGHGVVHFYSDESSSNEKRREFVDGIFNKYNRNKLFIFLVITSSTTLYQVNDILEDFYMYDKDCYVSVIIDNKIKQDSVRIVIGT